MVAFLTLVLGLASGSRAVDLAVGDGVAAVEVRLDGKVVGLLTKPPWTINVDFEDPPRPHFLAAVAFDKDGKEVGKAFQRINLPRSLAEANLLLLPGVGGKGRLVQLSWECAIAAEPTKAVLTFDGKPLPFSDPKRIPLPAFVPEQLHFMRADLDFPQNIAASAEITFGGQSKDETQAELTAVAVLAEGKKMLPALEGLILAGRQPARVVAVENEGPSEIAIVLDEAARETFARLAARYESRPALPRVPSSGGSMLLHGIAPLAPGQRARFVWPLTQTYTHGGARFEIFPRTQELDRSSGGLLYLLTHVFAPGVPDQPRLADAATVAGLSAVARNRARAVVLVLGGSRDGSAISPSGARSYLADLGVPLFVWTAGEGGAAAGTAWAGAAGIANVSTHGGFDDAARRLLTHVARQRIVWIEGVHLPQDVSLSPSASGLTLVR